MNVINVISGDATMDKLFHNADMFEEFKHYGQDWSFELPTEDEGELSYAVTHLVKHLQSKGDFVTAVWVAKKPYIHYVDWTVRVVSNGRQWKVLADYLKAFNLEQPENLEHHREHIQLAADLWKNN